MPTIKLGRKGGPCCPEPMKSDSEEMHYPSFYVDGDKKLDLPEEGTMTVKFRKTSESNSKGRDGKEHYSCSIDVMEVSNVKGTKASEDKNEESASDALDRLKNEAESEAEDEAEGGEEED